MTLDVLKLRTEGSSLSWNNIWVCWINLSRLLRREASHHTCSMHCGVGWWCWRLFSFIAIEKWASQRIELRTVTGVLSFQDLLFYPYMRKRKEVVFLQKIHGQHLTSTPKNYPSLWRRTLTIRLVVVTVRKADSTTKLTYDCDCKFSKFCCDC